MNTPIREFLPGLGLALIALCQGVPATTIYWIESDFIGPRIVRTDDSGSTTIRRAVSTQSIPQSLAYDLAGHRLLWTELAFVNARIRSSLSDLTDTATLIPSLSVLRGITVDRKTQKIYWVSTNLATGPHIGRAGLDGSAAEVVRDFGPSSAEAPWSIAVDSAGQVVYWTNFDTGSIEETAVAAPATEQTVVSGLNGPAGLALDPDSALLFWTELDGNTISRAHLDGSARSVIASGLGRPEAIGFDRLHRRIYWTESGAMAIRSSRTDGSDVRTLAITLAMPTGIAVVNDSLGQSTAVRGDPQLPRSYALAIRASGPAAKLVAVRYALPRPGPVELRLFGLQGTQRVLTKGQRQAGYYTIDIETGELAPGTYLLVMTAGTFVQTVRWVTAR
jgi:hypothetical protein